MRTDIFCQCLRVLPAGEVHIPSSFIDAKNVSQETICLKVIAQLQHILDNDVHLTSIGIIGLFEKMYSVFTFEKQGPCSVCGPIVKLLYTIMCTGCYGVNGSERVFLKNLAMINTRYFKTFGTLYPVTANECHASDGQQCAPHGCCFWELLELIVHAGAEMYEAGRFVTVSSLEYVSRFILCFCNNHIKNGCPVTLQRIARFVRMSLIHFTSAKDQTLLYKCITGLSTYAQDNEYVHTVVTELHMFVRNVLPLKTLTRQCIMQHIQWRDVKQLPLPTSLKVYIRLGDISADHPVCNMSIAQLAA